MLCMFCAPCLRLGSLQRIPTTASMKHLIDSRTLKDQGWAQQTYVDAVSVAFRVRQVVAKMSPINRAIANTHCHRERERAVILHQPRTRTLHPIEFAHSPSSPLHHESLAYRARWTRQKGGARSMQMLCNRLDIGVHTIHGSTILGRTDQTKRTEHNLDSSTRPQKKSISDEAILQFFLSEQ